MEIAKFTAVGGREKNEDAIKIVQNSDLFLALAADGLGYHGGGDIASMTAVEEIERCILAGYSLEDAIKSANTKVLKLHEDGLDCRTTIAALLLSDDEIIAANVGDTRIYQFRDDGIVYLSTDHSVPQMAVLIGDITHDEIRNHPDRNKLIRALGAEEELKVDISKIEARDGDVFLLCSDGLWENISDDELIEIMSRGSGTEICSYLEELVKEQKGEAADNNSAIWIKI